MGRWPGFRLDAAHRYPVCAFVAAFLVVLAAPLGWSLVGSKDNRPVSFENRKLAAFPDLKKSAWRTLPSRFDSYFSDNLGLRQRFLDAYLKLFSSRLRSPVGRNFTGKHGELFEKEVIVNALDLDPKSPEYLAMLRTTAAGTAAWFHLRDIPYYLFLMPDKSTLYPEWLPFYAGFVKHRGWYEDLEAALQSANIHFFSMREFFQEHKNDVRLYDRIFDNCHWNGNAISLFYRNMQQFIPEQIYNFRIPDAIGYVQVDDVKIEDKIYGDETVPFIAFPQRDFLEEKTKQFP